MNYLHAFEADFTRLLIADAQTGEGIQFGCEAGQVGQLRLTTESLTEVEAQYADFRSGPHQLPRRSPELFIGDPSKTNAAYLECKLSAEYCWFQLYRIYWYDSPDFHSPEGEVLQSAPPDIVLVFSKDGGAEKAPAKTCLTIPANCQNYLFAPNTRTIGPQLGQQLKVRVFLSPGKAPVLRPMGFFSEYRGEATQNGPLLWRDRWLIEIVEVDIERKYFRAQPLQLLERLGPP